MNKDFIKQVCANNGISEKEAERIYKEQEETVKSIKTKIERPNQRY